MIPILIIFGAGVVTGIYIASQIGSLIDKEIDENKKNSK